MEKLYRYTTNGEGVFSAGKRLLPEGLINEVNWNRKWLKKPNLEDGNYRFYLTKKGKEIYEKSLLLSHIKYLPNITLEVINRNAIKNIVYEDEHQLVEELRWN